MSEPLQVNKNCIKALCLFVFFFSVAVLAAQSLSQCVRRGEVSRQLEWVLLHAHFALLQRLIQQDEHQVQADVQRKCLVAKRCQALTSLIRLTSIPPCQELLDMQEKVSFHHQPVLSTPQGYDNRVSAYIECPADLFLCST